LKRILLSSGIILGFLIISCISACKKEHETIPLSDTVVDIDGNIYHSVTIGTQVWMLENLRTSRFNNGEPIPQVQIWDSWSMLESSGFCWYWNDSSTYHDDDGILYNWYAVSTGKLAPKGWHIPSEEEWMELATFLGGQEISGGKMKESGTEHWVTPNNGGTNESGFTAYASGIRSHDGQFALHGLQTGYWSSSQKWGWGISYLLSYDRRHLYTYLIFKEEGFSVRCVRD
jgi:uncharacterized protein (TIGR02145 family)